MRWPCRSTPRRSSTTLCGWPRARARRKSGGRRSNSRRRSSTPRSPRPPISTCIGNSGNARFGRDTAACISVSSAAAVAGSGRHRSPCRSNTEPTTVARAGSVPRAVTGSRSLMCEVADVSRNYLSGDEAYWWLWPQFSSYGDEVPPVWMTDLTQRRVLPTADLGFLTLEPCEPERRLLDGWLNTWSGVGHIVADMVPEDYDLELRRYVGQG